MLEECRSRQRDRPSPTAMRQIRNSSADAYEHDQRIVCPLTRGYGERDFLLSISRARTRCRGQFPSMLHFYSWKKSISPAYNADAPMTRNIIGKIPASGSGAANFATQTGSLPCVRTRWPVSPDRLRGIVSGAFQSRTGAIMTVMSSPSLPAEATGTISSRTGQDRSSQENSSPPTRSGRIP